MAYGAARYLWVDSKLGLSPGLAPPYNAQLWVASKTWAAKDVCYNGGFVFQTTAGGAGATSGVGPTPKTLTDNSCTWVLVGSIGGPYVSDATVQHDLGYIALAKDIGPNYYGIGEFRYIKFTGSTSIVAGDFIIVDAYGQTGVQAPASAPGANKISILGVAMGSHALATSTPTYGWVMVRGIYDGANIITTFTAGTILSGVGTAGCATANATPTTNYVFDGSVLRAGSAQGLCTVELYWPVCSGR